MIVVGNLLRIPTSILSDTFNTVATSTGINNELGGPRQSGSSTSLGGVGYTFKPSPFDVGSTAAIVDGKLLITSKLITDADVQTVWSNGNQSALAGKEYNVGVDFHFQNNSGNHNSLCFGILALDEIMSDQYYEGIDVELFLGPTGRWYLFQGANLDGSPIISANGTLTAASSYSVMLAFDETDATKTVDVLINGNTIVSDMVFTPGGNGRYVGLRYVGYTDAIYQMAFDNFVIDSLGVDAVPEPGYAVLLATGLIGLLAYAWRK